MSLLAPVLLILAVVIPVKLIREGVRWRKVGIGCAALGLLGLMLFISGLRDATPEAAAAGDPGRLGVVGILFVVASLVGGITLFIAGIMQVMSNSPKDKT